MFSSFSLAFSISELFRVRNVRNVILTHTHTHMARISQHIYTYNLCLCVCLCLVVLLSRECSPFPGYVLSLRMCTAFSRWFGLLQLSYHGRLHFFQASVCDLLRRGSLRYYFECLQIASAPTKTRTLRSFIALHCYRSIDGFRVALISLLLLALSPLSAHSYTHSKSWINYLCTVDYYFHAKTYH